MNLDFPAETSKFVSVNFILISDPSVNFLTISYRVWAETVTLPRVDTIHLAVSTISISISAAGAAIRISAAGAVSFAEINQGGIQIVTSATKLVRSDFNSSDAFSVTGSLSATGNITAFNSSDERLKNNIELIENPLDKVSQLNGVTFDWKEGFDDVHNYEGHDIGVIAQNVLHILPEITKINEINGYYGVRYEKLTPLLIEAIKELSSKIEKLENKLIGYFCF